MKYILRFPEGFRPLWWRDGDPTELIIEDGKHEKDFDLVVDDLPHELVERMYECNECLTREYHDKWSGREVTLALVDEWIKRPMGVSHDFIKIKGFTLIPIQ